ncbi:MAG: PKD domain-containing protein [Candidatus Methanomethylophilaceae archaeon]|nr:PKD domain-containing protein [Candidatus Methanomethylophilaceae archaeon]
MDHKKTLALMFCVLMAATGMAMAADSASADIDNVTGAGTEDDPYIITMYIGDTFYYNPLANLSNAKFYCTGPAVNGPDAFITLTGDPFVGYLMSGTAVATGTFDSHLIVSWTVDELTQTADQYIRFKVYDPSQSTTAILATMTTGSVLSAATEVANEAVYGAGIEGTCNAVGVNTTSGASYVRWDWGDGKVTTTMNDTCPHTYEKKGTYTITQTAYTSLGEAYSSAQYVYIVNDAVASGDSGDNKDIKIMDYLPWILLALTALLIFAGVYIGVPILWDLGIVSGIATVITFILKFMNVTF